jgi:4-hydroxy-2-oxoheptanedioate aldolase
VADCEAIAAVAGVDIVLIGPSDLTAEMGIHGQYENERFHNAVDSVAAACRSRGVALGVAGIRSLDLLQRFAGLGLRFISAGTDAGMMAEAATARAHALRELEGRTPHRTDGQRR